MQGLGNSCMYCGHDINDLIALAAATQGSWTCVVVNKAALDGMQSGSRHAHKQYMAQLTHTDITGQSSKR